MFHVKLGNLPGFLNRCACSNTDEKNHPNSLNDKEFVKVWILRAFRFFEMCLVELGDIYVYICMYIYIYIIDYYWNIVIEINFVTFPFMNFRSFILARFIKDLWCWSYAKGFSMQSSSSFWNMGNTFKDLSEKKKSYYSKFFLVLLLLLSFLLVNLINFKGWGVSLWCNS